MKSVLLKWLYGCMLGSVVFIFSVFGLFHCAGSNGAGVTPFSGLLSINGAAAVPFSWPSVRIETGGTSATITLTNTIAADQGMNTVSSIKLIVPNGIINNDIDLSTDPGNTSTYTETTTTSAGATISTEFKTKTKGVTGTTNIQSLAPNDVSGSLDAIFEDADGNTREVINGFFSFSS